MKISNSFQYDQAVRTLIDRQRDLDRVQQQIASGLRINRPSDSPQDTNALLRLDTSAARQETFEKNVNALAARLELEEGTVAQAVPLLDRFRVLLIDGINDTKDQGIDRGAIAIEMDGLIEQLRSLANTRDISGNYIFAGSRVTTPPYELDPSGRTVFVGDQYRNRIPVGESRSLQGNRPATEVFTKVVREEAGGAGQPVPFFTVLEQIATAMRAASSDLSSRVTAEVVHKTEVEFDLTGVGDGNQLSVVIGSATYTATRTAGAWGEFALSNGTPPSGFDGRFLLETTGPNAGRLTITNESLFTVNNATGGASATPAITAQPTVLALTSDRTDTGRLFLRVGDQAFETQSTLTQVPDGAGGTRTVAAIGFGALRFNLGDRIEMSVERFIAAEVAVIEADDIDDNGQLTAQGLQKLTNAINSVTSIEQLQRGLGELSELEGGLIGAQATIGAEQNAAEVQRDVLEDVRLYATIILSELQDVNYDEALTRLRQELLGLEAFRGSFSRTLQSSLFDFIG